MDNPDSIALMSVLEQTLHKHFTHALQGLLPPTLTSLKLKHVLDISCHTGAWAIDLALAYPGVTVLGLDREQSLIEVARRNAEIGNVRHVRFYQVSSWDAFAFPENSFDLIHMSVPGPLLHPAEWSRFLSYCRGILRPNGKINLVGLSLGPGSSEAYQRMCVAIDKVLLEQDYGFSTNPGTTTPGVYFPRLLREANFDDVTYLIRPINLGGPNNLEGRTCCRLIFLQVKRIKHVFLQYQVLQSDEFDTLIAQTLEDSMRPDFCAFGALLSAVAIKR